MNIQTHLSVSGEFNVNDVILTAYKLIFGG